MQWKCTVCDYTPDGETPPQTCPVCGADESKYVQVDAEADAAEDQEDPGDSEAPPVKKQEAATGATETKWRCTICGYVHTGPEPPDTCPVCGADRSFFERVDGEEDMPAEAQPSAGPADDQPDTSAGDRKWRCTVCGYVHTGPEPPEICPVCGADSSLFEEIIEDTGPEPVTIDPEPAAAAEETTVQRLYRQVTDLMVTQHAHPISVHIPNGVAPIGVLFLFLAVIFQSPGLEFASYCNMAVVLLSMPFVIFSGFNDWKKRFGGNMTYVFRTKIICAAIISIVLLILVLWRTLAPDVAFTGGGLRLLYLALHLIMFAAAALAGFMGGKLVFPTR